MRAGTMLLQAGAKLQGGMKLLMRPTGAPAAAVPVNIAREALQAAKRLKSDAAADRPGRPAQQQQQQDQQQPAAATVTTQQ
jgi:hypothetical protein